MLLLLAACATSPTDTASAGDSADTADTTDTNDTVDTVDTGPARPDSTTVELNFDRELAGHTLVVTRLHETDPTLATFGDPLVAVAVSGSAMTLLLPTPPLDTLSADDGAGAALAAKYLLTVHADSDADGVVDDDEAVLGHALAELLWSETADMPYGPGWNHVGFGTSCYAPGAGLETLQVHGFPAGDLVEVTGDAALGRDDARLMVADDEATWGDTPVTGTFTLSAAGVPTTLEGSLPRRASVSPVVVYADLDGSGAWSTGDERLGGVCDNHGDPVYAQFTDAPHGLLEAWAALDWYCGGWYPVAPGWQFFGGSDWITDGTSLTLDPACDPGWP